MHIDFAGPFRGKVFLLVHSHFKWLEVSSIESMSNSAVLKVLRAMFACFGIPKVLVFTSAEFAEFIEKKVKFVTSP